MSTLGASITKGGKLLFGRAYSLVVAPAGSAGTLGAIESTLGFDVSNLTIAFKVKKTLKPDPNTATVEIYNLAQASRKVLEDASKLVMRLEAGFVETGTSQIYFGEVRSAWTEWDGPTCKTTIATGDSEKEIQEARIHVPIGPGVPADIALLAIAKAIKVGPGNLAQAVALLKTKGLVLGMFGSGTVISGNAARELTDFCRSARLEWSIQDGKLQILDKSKPLQEKAVLLSPDSGLVGSPSIDFNATSKSKKGGIYVKARSFIIPDLLPGAKVVVDAKSVHGAFRIEEIEYTGETSGGDSSPWYADMVLRSY